MARLGIITGLQSEARLALDAAFKAGLNAGDIDVICEGPGLAHAHSAALRLVTGGARSLLSFGVAGALDVRLQPGTLLIPKEVTQADASALSVAEGRIQMILLALAAILTVERGPLTSTNDVIMSAAQKAELAAASGAVAVDMESYAVAKVAQDAGLPFAVLRAVADPADRAIPPAALAGVTPQGDVRPLKVMQALVRTPSALAPIMQLGRDNARAMASLGRAARLAFPLLLVGR